MFDIFGTKAPATPAPAAQPAPANASLEGHPPSVEPKATEGTAPNGAVPANAVTDPANPDKPASPLAEFDTLWDNDPTKATPAPETPSALDPAKLQEVIGKLDLSASVTPEIMAAINEGGEGATTAMMQAMNSVSQQALTHAITVSNKLIEQAVGNNTKAMEAKLPGMLKAQNLSNTMADTNPIFTNPAVKPIMEATQAQLLAKYPKATPQELTDMAEKYVLAMSEAFSGEKPASEEAASEMDWESFLAPNS